MTQPYGNQSPLWEVSFRTIGKDSFFLAKVAGNCGYQVAILPTIERAHPTIRETKRALKTSSEALCPTLTADE